MSLSSDEAGTAVICTSKTVKQVRFNWGNSHIFAAWMDGQHQVLSFLFTINTDFMIKKTLLSLILSVPVFVNGMSFQVSGAVPGAYQPSGIAEGENMLAPADTSSSAWTESISGTVVTGTRSETDIRHLPLTVSVVGRDRISQSFQPSLLPVLSEQVPGLFVTSRGIMGYGVSDGAAGNMSLRGLGGGSGRLMVLIDGHPQYMGLFGHPIADAYQSFLAEKVEVVRGPASVLYGSNAMGGVVNIVTRKMQEDGVRTDLSAGYGSYNTLQTEVTNRVRKNGFTSVVSGSYNRTDGHREDMDFEQYGGYAALGYEFTDNWKARADVNVTHFNSSYPGAVSDPLEDAFQSVTRGMTSFAVENRYDRTSGALSFFYNWGRHNINDGYHPLQGESPLDYRFNSSDDMMGVSLYQSAAFFRGNRVTAGVDWYRFGGKAWNRYVAGEKEGQTSSTIDQRQHEVAGYVDFRQDIWSWLTVDAGLRVDHHSHVGTEWIPQAGLSFRLPHDAGIKVTAGKGFRNPLIREMFMWGVKNPELRPERMWNYEVAFSQSLLDGRIRYGVNLFYIDAWNLITVEPVDGRMMNVNTGSTRNCGVEAEFAWRISRCWSADANYSYLHMSRPVTASPEHKLYAGAVFTEGRWNASTGVQYIGGLYTVTGQNPVQEDFVLWNMKVSFRITGWLSVWVRGDNLLAQEYEINAGYPMPGATVMGGLDISL